MGDAFHLTSDHCLLMVDDLLEVAKSIISKGDKGELILVNSCSWMKIDYPIIS